MLLVVKTELNKKAGNVKYYPHNSKWRAKAINKVHAIGHLRVKSISVNFLGKNDSHAMASF